MLDSNDEATVRFAIYRRLDKEPGITHTEIVVRPSDGFIAIGVQAQVGALLEVRSVFHLPDPFEHGHLLNEIDEIAEQMKTARRRFFEDGCPAMGSERRELLGSGLRGHWQRYGLRFP